MKKQREYFQAMVTAALKAAPRSDSSPLQLKAPVIRVTIEAVHGDITAQKVDVIVNAANEALAGGGGVDGAIHKAAGAKALQKACAELGGCPTGDAKLTPGFKLSARHIVHAVGPIWQGGDKGEADLLAACYRKALALCDEVGAVSVAFPAISTGVYGYPAAQAAEIAIKTLRDTPTKVRKVVLVAFDEGTLGLYQSLLS